MYTGKQGKYYWLEQVNLRLDEVLKVGSEFVGGNYLVVTSFDSGPLQLGPEDFERGWLQHGELAINPSVQSVDDIPYDQFDEWYVLRKRQLVSGLRSLTLRNKNSTNSSLAPGDIGLHNLSLEA